MSYEIHWNFLQILKQLLQTLRKQKLVLLDCIAIDKTSVKVVNVKAGWLG